MVYVGTRERETERRVSGFRVGSEVDVVKAVLPKSCDCVREMKNARLCFLSKANSMCALMTV